MAGEDALEVLGPLADHLKRTIQVGPLVRLVEQLLGPRQAIDLDDLRDIR